LFTFTGLLFLSLNNPLHLTGLAREPTSASNATFTGASAKTELSFLFCLRFSLSASAFGKGLFSIGNIWYRYLSENE
jgi:hypothetical protein